MKKKNQDLVMLIEKHEGLESFAESSTSALKEWDYHYNWNLEEFKNFRETPEEESLRSESARDFSFCPVTHYRNHVEKMERKFEFKC